MLMSGPGFIRIERGSDGAHVLELNKVPRYAHFCIILSELGNFMYVFNCRLAVKCYCFYKMLYIFIHFWNLKYLYHFSAAILDFGSHFESVYGHKGTKYKLNYFLYIKCHSLTILYLIPEI